MDDMENMEGTEMAPEMDMEVDVEMESPEMKDICEKLLNMAKELVEMSEQLDHEGPLGEEAEMMDEAAMGMASYAEKIAETMHTTKKTASKENKGVDKIAEVQKMLKTAEEMISKATKIASEALPGGQLTDLQKEMNRAAAAADKSGDVQSEMQKARSAGGTLSDLYRKFASDAASK